MLLLNPKFQLKTKKMHVKLMGILSFAVLAATCRQVTPTTTTVSYVDTAFMQDYSVKYFVDDDQTAELRQVYASREGKVQVLATDGLKHPTNGHFLYPGQIVDDQSYRFMSAKQLVDVALCRGEHVYLDRQVIFSNAWSGRLYVEHQLTHPTAFVANDSLNFLVTDGSQVHLVDEDTVKWTGEVPGGGVLQLISDPTDPAVFFVLTSERIFQFSTVTNQLEKIHEGRGFTCADVDARNKQL